MTTTQVRQSRSAPALLGLATLALGVGLGFALPPLARWLRDAIEQTPLPLHGLVGVLADMPWVWSVPVLGALGLAAAAYVARASVVEALALDVAGDHVEHRIDGLEGWIERDAVASVHPDRGDLVFLGPGGRPRARLDASALETDAVRDALRAHGWPWRDDDPYDAGFVPWVEGRPGFDDAESRLLARRRDGGKDRAAQREVDAELAARGIAVRVRDGRLQARRCAVAGTDRHDAGAAADEGTRGTDR